MSSFLIADDSEDKIHFLHGIVKEGWKGDVLIARTTEEAKELIDRHPDIGAAFIDYYMPSEHGPAVIRYLKQKNPVSRVALVSSADSAKNAAEARAAGADAVVCSMSWSAEETLRGLVEEWGES